MHFKHRHRGLYFVDVIQRDGRITLGIEFENLFEVSKRLPGKDDHAILRALGRAAGLPWTRSRR